MYGVLKRSHSTAGADEQERLHLDFDVMFAREHGNALGLLFDYWSDRRASGDLPRIGDFRPEAALPPESLAFVHRIDTRAESPTSYVFDGHVESPFPMHGRLLSGKRVIDFPSGIHRVKLAEEYFACVRERTPRYDEISGSYNGWLRSYRRILLPVADATGSVAALYYAIRRLEDSRPIAA